MLTLRTITMDTMIIMRSMIRELLHNPLPVAPSAREVTIPMLALELLPELDLELMARDVLTK